MSKTFVRITFAVITAVYVLTHFLGHARAEAVPMAAAAVVQVDHAGSDRPAR